MATPNQGGVSKSVVRPTTLSTASANKNFLYPHQEVVQFVMEHQKSSRNEDSNFTDVNGINFPHPRSSSMTIRRPRKPGTPTSCSSVSNAASPWDAAGFYGMAMHRSSKSIYEGITPHHKGGGRRRSYTLSGGSIGSWPSSRKR